MFLEDLQDPAIEVLGRHGVNPLHSRIHGRIRDVARRIPRYRPWGFTFHDTADLVLDHDGADEPNWLVTPTIRGAPPRTRQAGGGRGSGATTYMHSHI
jgi:hypothetical protein